jgi:energy-dependent translational throttle protein EttA
MENINLGVQKHQALLDRFNQLSARCSESLPAEEADRIMNELADVQGQIDAQNLWLVSSCLLYYNSSHLFSC